MMFNSHKARLNRFLGSDGRCLDVAIDHGIFKCAHNLYVAISLIVPVSKQAIRPHIPHPLNAFCKHCANLETCS